MVLLGTLYPMLADALDLGPISFGPPSFSQLFVLLMAPLVALLPFGPLTKWQREQPSRIVAMLLPWAIFAIVAAALAWWLAPQGKGRVVLGIAGAAWVLAGTLRFVWSRWKNAERRFTAEMLGMALAHCGVALFLAGALLTDALSQQRELALKPGQTVQLGRDCYEFIGAQRREGPNYLADFGSVRVLDKACSNTVDILHP
jgi:cytochrome c-type biogenesis protein CcmF